MSFEQSEKHIGFAFSKNIEQSEIAYRLKCCHPKCELVINYK